MLLLYVFCLFVDPPQTSTPLDLRGEFVKMTSLVEEMDPLQFRGGIHIASHTSLPDALVDYSTVSAKQPAAISTSLGSSRARSQCERDVSDEWLIKYISQHRQRNLVLAYEGGGSRALYASDGLFVKSVRLSVCHMM